LTVFIPQRGKNIGHRFPLAREDVGVIGFHNSISS
jgi:hypothetical protein